MKNLNVKIKLNQLVHHAKNERRSRATPYLWTIFFKLDGTTIELTHDFKLNGKGVFQFTPGSHGNLGNAAAMQKNPIAIPSAIGEWQTELKAFHIPYFEQKAPSIIGAICVLMEQNNVSGKGAEAGHQALNKKVQEAVNKTLKEFDPKVVDIHDAMGSIRRFFESKVTHTTETIQDDIIDAIKGSQTLLRNLWTFVNADNLVGFHVWNVNQQEIDAAENGVIPLSHHWKTAINGDWEIKGSIERIQMDVTEE